MLASLGLFGLFLGCMLSATIIPFSSEFLVAGAMKMQAYPLFIIILVASIGNTAGGMISFLMGWLCKWEWLEKYFKVNREKLMKVHVRVNKYGVWTALLSWAPLVGDLISIALGLMRTNPWKTLAVMFVGKAFRYVVTANLLVQTGWF